MFEDIKYSHNPSSKYQASASSDIQSYRTLPLLLLNVFMRFTCVHYHTVGYTRDHIHRAL